MIARRSQLWYSVTINVRFVVFLTKNYEVLIVSIRIDLELCIDITLWRCTRMPSRLLYLQYAQTSSTFSPHTTIAFSRSKSRLESSHGLGSHETLEYRTSRNSMPVLRIL